ncbi:MAG: DUF4442 domain-containing protein [Aliivibrio sp.]|uniref:PaaI family thioesterase n=1 Tax=Aliivibrio sp. TaxID=1872443 RepID=UPI001A44470B|nr:DUF4442 domain-containing protein [Aliivibrio sp.]
MSQSLFKSNLMLKMFGFFKVPLIFWCKPKIIAMDEQTLAVKIPLLRRNKNHLNSMYFGVLAVGADVAGGFLAFHKANNCGRKISLAFKDFDAKFLKRPEADVVFTCSEGQVIDQMLTETFHSKERINKPVQIVATCPSISGDEPVALFTLMLSIKVID